MGSQQNDRMERKRVTVIPKEKGIYVEKIKRHWNLYHEPTPAVCKQMTKTTIFILFVVFFLLSLNIRHGCDGEHNLRSCTTQDCGGA